MTYFYKKVFPVIWITGFALLTFFIWFGCQATSHMKWLALVCLIAGSIFLFWFSSRLKTVKLRGDHIIISDYSSEELIPIIQIEEVKETRIWNPKLIKLRLNRPAAWGDEVIFIAPVRLQFVFTHHPLVKELRALIGEKRRG